MSAVQSGLLTLDQDADRSCTFTSYAALSQKKLPGIQPSVYEIEAVMAAIREKYGTNVA
jgi:hypothetical protein